MGATLTRGAAPAEPRPTGRLSHLLLLAGGLLGAAGWWLPWVLHESGAAALALLGLDLGEFWKFTGEWRAGLLEAERVLFFLPPALAAMLLAVGLARWRGRWLLLPLLLFLSVVVLPAADILLSVMAWLPPRITHPGLAREYGFQLYLSLSALLVVLLLPLWRRLPAGAGAVVAAALALAGALLPPWALWRTWLVLDSLYGGGALPGPGLLVSSGGFLLAAFGALQGAIRARRSPAGDRAPAGAQSDPRGNSPARSAAQPDHQP